MKYYAEELDEAQKVRSRSYGWEFWNVPSVACVCVLLEERAKVLEQIL
jgi:hypothetical protein